MKKTLSVLGQWLRTHYFISIVIAIGACSTCVVLFIVAETSKFSLINLFFAMSFIAWIAFAVNSWQCRYGHFPSPIKDLLRDSLKRENQLEKYSEFRSKYAARFFLVGALTLLFGIVGFCFR